MDKSPKCELCYNANNCPTNYKDVTDCKEYRSMLDLLSPEKNCPECNGHGLLPITLSGELAGTPDRKCLNCNGTKKVQIYYTPEDYERIIGEPFSEDSIIFYLLDDKWYIDTYKKYKKMFRDVSKDLNSWGKVIPVVIVQTNQRIPDSDYRPED